MDHRRLLGRAGRQGAEPLLIRSIPLLVLAFEARAGTLINANVAIEARMNDTLARRNPQPPG